MVFTRYEIAEKLNVPPNRADMITRKLKREGYKFITSGRGNNYLVEILEEPNQDLLWFAKHRMGIKARDKKKLAHLLNLLFFSGDDEMASHSYRDIACNTYYGRDAIKDCIEAMKAKNILNDFGIWNLYFATVWVKGNPDCQTGIYYKYLKTKKINSQDWHRSYEAFYDSYRNDMKDIDLKPDMIEEIATIKANQAKKDALKGWWPYPVPQSYLQKVDSWPYWSQLEEILKQYPYEPYKKPIEVDGFKEQEEENKKTEEIERKLKAKRELLARTNRIPIGDEGISVDDLLHKINDTGNYIFYDDEDSRRVLALKEQEAIKKFKEAM